MDSLANKKCVPCEAGVPPMPQTEAQKLMPKLKEHWRLEQNKIFAKFKFQNFKAAMDFVNKVAEIAEEEGHHPDIAIHYNRVEIELFTHAIKGLSENDFILAAKIDNLL